MMMPSCPASHCLGPKITNSEQRPSCQSSALKLLSALAQSGCFQVGRRVRSTFPTPSLFQEKINQVTQNWRRTNCCSRRHLSNIQKILIIRGSCELTCLVLYLFIQQKFIVFFIYHALKMHPLKKIVKAVLSQTFPCIIKLCFIILKMTQ